MSQSRNMPLVFQAKLYELQQNQDGDDVWIERGVGIPSFVREEVPISTLSLESLQATLL
jgi:hypothetical protein